jgi:nicotinamide-nucleotide amidase
MAQAAVATTGIAGPDGGSVDKPVGTVCFAWAIRRDPAVAPWVRTTTRLFDGDRAAIRTQAVLEALDGLNVLLEQRLDV